MMRTKHITISPRGLAARLALLHARRDLEHRLLCREAIAVERQHDPIDEALRLQEREHVALVASADSDRLREVTDALQRLDAGTWGVCGDCGEAIPPARLAALPWAANCVRCQTQAEMAEVEA